MKRKGIICFIKQEDKVLLIQVDYGDGKLFWNGVSGFVDSGEELTNTVIREVREEVGIEIDVSSLVHKGTQVISHELTLEVFTAIKWTGEPQPKEESIKDIKWFDIRSLPFDQMFLGNQKWLSDLL